MKKSLKMALANQHIFALGLLDFHGGQSSGLYAVGSCMLSDCQKGVLYCPERVITYLLHNLN